MQSRISVQINHRAFETEVGTTIIQVADKANIYIPRFCYHKKLSVPANCRMCLIEVKGAHKPLPACATPVVKDMQIFTRSDKVKLAQKAVMEFLLLNHPLDCPICDQGGQCELQDLAMGYGAYDSNFKEEKRVVLSEKLGPLIETNMTRCIQCTRCTRFSSEIAGNPELGMVDRGENSKITTYISKNLHSALSGNMIDVCPVGALTAKPSKFKTRPWEIKQIPFIAPHDCLGSNIYLHVYHQKVTKVVPRENDTINETWLSDRDRYSYLGLDSQARLTEPMIKIGNSWQVTDWQTALGQATRYLKNTVNRHGPEQLGGLISSYATTEELYLFQKLCRLLGSSNIDHRIKEVDTRDQAHLPIVPQASLTLLAIEQSNVIILIGTNLQKEQPLLIARLRKAIQKGATVIALNCLNYSFSFKVIEKFIIPPDQLVTQVATLARHCGAKLSVSGISVAPDPRLAMIAKVLQAAKKAVILTGSTIHYHPQAANLRYWLQQLIKVSGADYMDLTEGPNSAGAWFAGAIPHRHAGGKMTQQVGLSAHEMFTNRLKAYLLFNIEPDLDCANPMVVQRALQSAECNIAFTVFKSPSLLKHAHVLLPVTYFAENTGSFINVEGNWQNFRAGVEPPGNSRPGWKMLIALRKMLQLEEKDYDTISDLQAFLSALQPNTMSTYPSSLLSEEPKFLPMVDVSTLKEKTLMRITEWLIYSTDALVRHTQALQMSGSNQKIGAYLHPKTAQQLCLAPGENVKLVQEQIQSDNLSIILSDCIPPSCVWTPAGCVETAKLGATFGIVNIQKASL